MKNGSPKEYLADSMYKSPNKLVNLVNDELVDSSCVGKNKTCKPRTNRDWRKCGHRALSKEENRRGDKTSLKENPAALLHS
ncbi:hypothetical protein FRX31_020971 [Thalictrum thalictroides]|uniref:Uncharacterized protein n=1 Tax=Thalictrum thalictroides TaxID=46969 RepID=A0A7J6VX94_THATH|nr:hypothetical protein FRX31_020971 [Thalictrum thalictroides]